MRTLEQTRAYWEKCPGTKVVGHWNFPKFHFAYTIMANGDRYDLIRYFAIGGHYEASVDVQRGTTADIFDRIAQLCDGEKEGDDLVG